MIRRREFITPVGGAAAWPLAAEAQRNDRMRVVGMLISASGNNDPQFEIRVTTFRDTLATRLG